MLMPAIPNDLQSWREHGACSWSRSPDLVQTVPAGNCADSLHTEQHRITNTLMPREETAHTIIVSLALRTAIQPEIIQFLWHDAGSAIIRMQHT